MLRQIYIATRLVIEMGEIPGILFIGVGLLVSAVSLFVTVVRPVEKPTLFYLTLAMGAVFVIYGAIKMNLKRKKNDSLLEEKMKKSRERGDSGEGAGQRTAEPAGHGPYASAVNNPYSNVPQHMKINGYAAQPQAQHPALQQHQRAAQQAYPQYSGQQASQAAYSQHAQQAAQARRRFCPNCGSPVEAHHRFCSSCGGRVA